MGKNAKAPRSFNTIRRTQTKERAKRGQLSRVVLLAIFGVTALLLLSLLILGICAIADAIAKRPDNTPDGGTPSSPSINVRYDEYHTARYEDTQKGALIIVNKDHRYELFDYENGNGLTPGKVTLVNMYNNRSDLNGLTPYKVGENEQMEKTAFEAFDRMMLAYLDYSGKQNIAVGRADAYRTYDEQAGKSAPQGYSDHHTGYCVALTVSVSGQGISEAQHAWIFNNAHKYGFVMRYPDEKSSITGVAPGYEYCFRYVGVAHATYMKEHGYCLEEYVEVLKQNHTINNPLRTKGADGHSYDVYYVPAVADQTLLTNFLVPSNYQYTISGDNCGGFIVTVDLSKKA